MFRLSAHCQRLAAAFLCEVGYRDFNRFCELSNWAHSEKYRELLDVLWEELRYAKTPTIEFDHSLIPDVDELDKWEVTLACNAGIGLEAACGTPKPLRNCLEILSDSTDQIVYALGQREEAFEVLEKLVAPAITLLEKGEPNHLVDRLRKLPASRWTT